MLPDTDDIDTSLSPRQMEVSHMTLKAFRGVREASVVAQDEGQLVLVRIQLF